MRSPNRRRHAALAVLTVGILITAGCGGSDGGANEPSAKELVFQPVTEQGSDPFTQSTVTGAPRPAAPAPQPSSAQASADTARAARALPGSTPGLYGAARSVSSCDVERQIRLLTEDRTKSRAFARGADLGGSAVPAFLRGLTPVVLRADARVTSHGFRGGAAAPFQSVLQAGTAVMVDGRGLPRVRCACGNPLRPPVAIRGAVSYQGNRWPAYSPGRVVVINRAATAVDSLVVADDAEGAWIERRTGTDGEEDAVPSVLPPYGPEADITDPEAVKPPRPTPTGSASPEEESPAPLTPPGEPGEPTETTFGPGDTLPPDLPSEEAPSDPPTETGTEPPPPGDDGMFPVLPDQEEVSDVLTGPDAFQG